MVDVGDACVCSLYVGIDERAVAISEIRQWDSKVVSQSASW